MPFFLAPLAAKLIGGAVAKGAAAKGISSVAAKVIPKVSSVAQALSANKPQPPMNTASGTIAAEQSFLPRFEQPQTTQKTTANARKLPTWAKWTLGAVGGLGVIFLLLNLFKRKRR